MIRAFIVYLLAVAVLTPEAAHAYLDAGSGSMILQLLLAGLAGAGMFIKLFWRRIVGIFRR